LRAILTRQAADERKYPCSRNTSVVALSSARSDAPYLGKTGVEPECSLYVELLINP
jgi:hypothetical protein